MGDRRAREAKQNTWGALNGSVWVQPDIRDSVVDFTTEWSERTEVPADRFIGWIGIQRGKYFAWKLRHGKVNEHNGRIPRDHWLTPAETLAALPRGGANHTPGPSQPVTGPPPHRTRIQLTLSPSLPALLDALTARLAVCLPSPFGVEHVVVPGSPLGQWLAAELADRMGVWCNHAVYAPERMLERLGGVPADEISAWQVRDALHARLGSAGFEAPNRYLVGDHTGIRSIQLSVRIATLFATYCRYRPEMMAGWRTAAPDGGQSADDGAWQATLWRDVSAGSDPLAAVDDVLQGSPTRPLPSRLTVFAVDHMAPVELALLRGLDARMDVAVLALIGTPLVEALAPGATVTEFPGPSRSTLLAGVQSRLLSTRSGAAPVPDGSLLIHATHGPMREVEILRDRLLALFSADPTLQPEDVLVLAPDINDYAALLIGVFGSEEDISKRKGARARVPLCFTDRSPVVDAPGLAAMKSLLMLPHSRRPISIVGELLSIAPVHARFGLSEDDAVTARGWLESAGVRWGEDAAFRERFHNPTLPQYTWRWGLDRLLLGYAIEGRGERLFADILPVDGIEGNNAQPLGGLCAFCGALFEHLGRMEETHTPTEWATVLLDAYDALVSTRGTWASSRLVLVRALDGLAGERPVAIGAVADWLTGQLQQVHHDGYFFTGGVTCASLRSGRVAPARVVALLGLDDDRFPRDPTPLAFDLCANDPRPGDLPARTADRLVFRSAVLAAGDHLHLSYTGHGSRDNKGRPPSVLISELLDPLPAAVRAAVTVSHPMQPFSPRAFGEGRTPNYSVSLHKGARALLGEPTRAPQFFPVPLPADSTASSVDLAVLVRFFQNPVAALLKRRLDLSFETAAEPPGDTEPFDLSYLDQWKVGDRLVRAMLGGAEAEALWPAVRESGLLPLGTPGRILYDNLAATATVIAAEALGCGAGAARPNVDLDVLLAAAGPTDAVRLTGRLDGRRAGGGLYVTYSKLDGKRRLHAWIQHLASQAAGLTPCATWAVGRAKKDSADLVAWQATPAPAERLGQLLALHAEGMTRPLPFMPKSSLAYAEKYLSERESGLDEPELRREAGLAAYKCWLPTTIAGGEELPGEGDDPAVARVFDSSVVWSNEFHGLALRVFAPMLGEHDLAESRR